MFHLNNDSKPGIVRFRHNVRAGDKEASFVKRFAVEFYEGFADNKVNFAVRMGKSGESLLQLTHRVYSALDDIIAEYSGRTVLLVTHGGVCRVIETYFNDMTNEQFSNWFMDNCGLLEYNI